MCAQWGMVMCAQWGMVMCDNRPKQLPGHLNITNKKSSCCDLGHTIAFFIKKDKKLIYLVNYDAYVVG